MTECASCNEKFKWDDDVILVNDELYHKYCVELVPSEYLVYVDGEFIGESECYDGRMAYEYVDGLSED